MTEYDFSHFSNLPNLQRSPALLQQKRNMFGISMRPGDAEPATLPADHHWTLGWFWVSRRSWGMVTALVAPELYRIPTSVWAFLFYQTICSCF